MAVSFGCVCPERKKPVNERRWVVVQRRCNHSAFNGYKWTPSNYSDVVCLSCGAGGRTKAAYVAGLRDMTQDDDYYLLHPTHYSHDGSSIPLHLREEE